MCQNWFKSQVPCVACLVSSISAIPDTEIFTGKQRSFLIKIVYSGCKITQFCSLLSPKQGKIPVTISLVSLLPLLSVLSFFFNPQFVFCPFGTRQSLRSVPVFSNLPASLEAGITERNARFSPAIVRISILVISTAV